MSDSKQQDFDIILTGIRWQGGFSGEIIEPEGSSHYVECRYRNEANDGRCAAGWLIPDDKYSAGFEGRNVAASYIHSVIDTSFNINDVLLLQRLHDNAAQVAVDRGGNFFDLWEPEMADFAARHGLNYEQPR